MTTLVPKFEQPETGAVNRPINIKFQDSISVKDFGALGDNTGATPASEGVDITNAPWNVWPSFINGSNYLQKPGQDYGDAAWLAANKPFSNTDTWDFIGIQLTIWTGLNVYLPQGTYIINRSLRYVGGVYGTFHGDHQLLSLVQMKDRDTFPSISANIGKPLLYFYRSGFSGVTVTNVGFTTTITSGFNGDANTLIGNLTNATSCIAMTNTDSVQILDVFMSGTGEMGVNLYDQCAITITNLTTEYYSCHILMQAGCNLLLQDSNIYNSWRNTDTAKRVAGVLVYGPNSSLKCYRTNFWEMFYGAVYSESNTNSLVFHDNTVTNAYDVITPTDGTGYLMYLSQVGSGTAGVGSFDIQDNSFLFGNNSYAPLVLISLYPSIFSGNFCGTAGTAVTWGAMQLKASNSLVSNNSFDITQVASPSAGGNIIYGSSSPTYSDGTSNILFSNNIINNQTTKEVAVNGVISNNVGNTTIGTITLGAAIVSGTDYTLVAADVLETGAYLIDITISEGSYPYKVSATGIAQVDICYLSSQGKGPNIALSQINYENDAISITVNPLPGTGVTNGFTWTPNFSYAGTDAVVNYKIVRMA